MNLSAELFDSIVGRLRGDRGRPAERRAAARVGLCARTEIRIEQSTGGLGPFTAARVRDLSAGGISLLLPTRLVVGTGFVLYLPRAKGDPVRFYYTAVNVRAVGDQFIIGAKFHRKFEDMDELRKTILRAHVA